MRNGINDCSHHTNAQDNVVQVRDLMAPLLQEQDTEGVVRRLQMIGMDVLSSTTCSTCAADYADARFKKPNTLG